MICHSAVSVCGKGIPAGYRLMKLIITRDDFCVYPKTNVVQLFSALTFSFKTHPEAGRMFGDTYSVKGRQPFDIRALRDGRNV